MKEKLLHVNQARIAEILGLTTRHIRNLEDAGLPSVPREGREKLYHVPSVVPWYVAYQVDLALKDGRDNSDIGVHKARKLKAEADMAEMEARKMAGELMDAKAANLAWTAFLSRLKVNLDGYPDRAAQLLQDGLPLAEKIDVLRREMNALRRDLVAEIQREAQEAEAL